ncbi:MAG TPA: FAD-dependent oxidoreductase [Anaerolineales bacterium]|nr:FAD-dependent oxidoreductase [Anaerolineales bacterium]
MKTTSAQVVICGAGIAGISAAYFLAVQQGVKEIILVDERPPLSLTSDHSTECYRNWWPGPGDAMVAMMNRSIDWLEKLASLSGNVFHLNRRGYLYCSADLQQVERMQQQAQEISRLGAGELRIHNRTSCKDGYQPDARLGWAEAPAGADLLLNQQLIRQHYPFLSQDVIAALHVRRAGWFSAQQLGMYLLDQARQAGVKVVASKITGIELQAGQVHNIVLDSGDQLGAQAVVLAAGPFLDEIANFLGIQLPIHHELHLKAAFKDSAAILPRQAPLVIWNDPQRLDWSPEEAEYLRQDTELSYLLDELPAGVHTRPEGEGGSQVDLLLWEYKTRVIKPVYPTPEDHQYLEISLQGLSRMIPGMRTYLNRLPQPRYDGGYYTKTPENRPLIGKLPVPGAYVIGALSGFGLMAACAAGELLALQLTGADLPAYAPAFSLDRYLDPDYVKATQDSQDSGQL